MDGHLVVGLIPQVGEAYNRLLTDKKRYIRACEIIRDTLADTSAIDAELDELLREKEVVEELTKKLLQENAFSADEPDGFQVKYLGTEHLPGALCSGPGSPALGLCSP